MEPNQSSARLGYCKVCNVTLAMELLLEHRASAEHKERVAVEMYARSFPENGVKLKGLKPGYDAAKLTAAMNNYGKTIFAHCPFGSGYATFVFQDTHSAKTVLAERRMNLFGQRVRALPWQMRGPREPQPYVSGQTWVKSAMLGQETQAAEVVGGQPKNRTRTRPRRKPNPIDGEQLGLPNDHQIGTNRTKPTVIPKIKPKKKPLRSPTCFTCKESFADREQFTQHVNATQHQQVRDVESKEVRGGAKSVQLRGLEPGYDAASLEAMMETFGKISRANCPPRGRNATFEYQESYMAAAVLNFGRLEFDGRKLTVRPMRAPKKQSAEDLFVKEARSAVDRLDASLPIEEQLRALEKRLSDPAATRAGRVMTLLADVMTAVGSLYPDVLLHPFGSSSTDLAFFNSDVDLYMEVPIPDKKCVHLVTDRLRRAGHPFVEVVPVVGAKTPLVKFHHSRTGLSCDVSFKNCLGVRNSRLLRHFMGMHPRVRQLMVTVKLWARLLGVANGRGGVTSYALVLMVVFHLQRLGLVPPIADMQKSEQHAETVDGWSCGFCPAAGETIIEQSLASLLKSFFSFYSNFVWERFVVCPLLGKEVDREDLLDPNKLPPEMGTLRAKHASNDTAGFQSESAKVICVQDPFVLEHNLTRGVVPSKARELINLIVSSDHMIAQVGDSQVLQRLLSVKNKKVAQAMSGRLCRVHIMRKLTDKDEWVSRLWGQLAKVLMSVLKLRVTPVFCGKGIRIMELSCRGFHDTVTGRTNVEKRLSAEDRYRFEKLSPIDRQVAITDMLLGEAVVKKINPEPMVNNIREMEISNSLKNFLRISEDTGVKSDIGDVEETNAFGVLEGINDEDSYSGDDLEDDEKDLAIAAVGEPLMKVTKVGDGLNFMKDVDFTWDSGLVDPVDCKPMAQFTVRGVKRRDDIAITFQNNGSYGRYISELAAFIERNLCVWIQEELNLQR